MKTMMTVVLAGLVMAMVTLPGQAAVSDADKAAILAAAQANTPTALKALVKALMTGKTTAEAQAIASELIAATLASGNTAAEITDMVALITGAVVVTSGDSAAGVAGAVAQALAGTDYVGAGIAAIVVVTNNDTTIVNAATGSLTGDADSSAASAAVSDAAGTIVNEASVVLLQDSEPQGNQYEGQTN